MTLWPRIIKILLFLILITRGRTLKSERQCQCGKSYNDDGVENTLCKPRTCGIFETSLLDKDLVRKAKNLSALVFDSVASQASKTIDLVSLSFMSKGKVVNLEELLAKKTLAEIISTSDDLILALSNELIDNIQKAFRVKNIYLGRPILLSDLHSLSDDCESSEYWKDHVDRFSGEYSLAFIFTAVVYLSSKGVDFEGGDLVFPMTSPLMPKVTFSPFLSRTVIFTSGEENPHYVEKVSSGSRRSLTFFFTCDKHYSVWADLK